MCTSADLYTFFRDMIADDGAQDTLWGISVPVYCFSAMWSYRTLRIALLLWALRRDDHGEEAILTPIIPYQDFVLFSSTPLFLFSNAAISVNFNVSYPCSYFRAMLLFHTSIMISIVTDIFIDFIIASPPRTMKLFV